MYRYLSKILAFAGKLFVIAGGLLAIAGSAMPWANAVLFDSIHVTLPGLVFASGAAAVAFGAAMVFSLRHPILCVAVAAALLIDTSLAAQQIPHDVRGGLLAAQKGFFPINELLYKFDLTTVMVGDYGAKDSSFLGPGLAKTTLGGLLALCGGLLGLPRDPWLSSGARRFIRMRCRACGAAWPLGRDALYCPNCSEPTPKASNVCRNCMSPVLPKDIYCVKCGTARLL